MLEFVKGQTQKRDLWADSHQTDKGYCTKGFEIY